MGAQLIPRPHMPTVEPIDSPTNQQFITIEGTKGADTSIMINGVERVPLNSETEWIVSSYNLGTDGNKTLIITSKNSQNRESSPVTVNIVLDTAPPTITITSPLDGAIFDTAPITVSGTINEECDVIVNSILATADGTTFTADGINLHYGENILTASAYDYAGNYTTATITVTSTVTSEYELIQISPDIYEYDPTLIAAGGQVTLTVKLEIENSPVANEPIEFTITQGNGSMVQAVVNTTATGEASGILITDIDAFSTNLVDAHAVSFPDKKVTFHIDTKEGIPATLIKVTDEAITPAPNATIPLAVRLTDQYGNPIPSEGINFVITQGGGTLSANSATTDDYGNASVNFTAPASPSMLNQITVSSSNYPSVSAVFSITTSGAISLTVQDLFNAVQLNAQKIQDQVLQVTVTSDHPSKPPTADYQVWLKDDLMKVKDIATGEITIRTPVTTGGAVSPEAQIVDYNAATNVYGVKMKAANQEEERPYTVTYIDYTKGVITRTEFYYATQELGTSFVVEMSDFVQIPQASAAWVYNVKTEKMYGEDDTLVSTTTATVTSRQVNVGLTSADFQ